MESEFGVREECGGHREGRLAFGEFRYDGGNRWLNDDEVRLTLRGLRFQFASDDVGDGSRRGINLSYASPVIMCELECRGSSRQTPRDTMGFSHRVYSRQSSMCQTARGACKSG